MISFVFNIIFIIIIVALLYLYFGKSRDSADPVKLQKVDLKETLGFSTWLLLHTTFENYPQDPRAEDKETMRLFLDNFSKLYPCERCLDHLQEYVSKYPPDLTNRNSLTRWGWTLHNNVNARINKPLMSWEDYEKHMSSSRECDQCKVTKSFE